MNWKTTENIINLKRGLWVFACLLISVIGVVVIIKSLFSLYIYSDNEDFNGYSIEQKILQSQFDLLHSSSYPKVDSAVAVIAASFQKPLEIIEYLAPEQIIKNEVRITKHNIRIRGEYMDVITHLYDFEKNNPRLFIVSYSIISEFTTKQNIHKSKEKNEKVLADIIVVHYAI